MTVAITCQDLSAADLRQAAARTQDAKMARRMLAIALVLEGCSRAEAAEICAMDRQTLRDWVHRYNASGLDGLSDQPRRNGPLPRLSVEQQAEVAVWVDEGADLKRDGVVRWRRVDPAPDRAQLWRLLARAHDRQAAAHAVVPPPVGASAASEERC